MKLELTTKQFRRLLDMAYIGNWILNSTRGDDRFKDYDDVESLLFAKAREEGMGVLAEDWQGEVVPSRAFAEGGIHEAIDPRRTDWGKCGWRRDCGSWWRSRLWSPGRWCGPGGAPRCTLPRW